MSTGQGAGEWSYLYNKGQAIREMDNYEINPR
jgi:hypothetical protein